MTKIRDALIESNPWWKQPYVLDYKSRELYTRIQPYLPLPQILAFTGLRRVGKTTLMFKLIHDALTKGTPPQNILYFSFDDFQTSDIRTILSEYELLLGKNITSERTVILLDEIQKLVQWEEQLKRIYDTHSKTMKIIISGSESLFIRTKSKETLAGRLFEFKVDPLTFPEFLTFRGNTIKPFELYEKELNKEFIRYIRTQGFPELVSITEKDIIKKYIKESIIEKIIYRDIPKLLKIKDVSLLETILNILMEEPGQLIEQHDLSKDLHVTRQTLSTYLRYLEDSYLLKKLYNYSRNRRKTERKLKRYYPTILSVDLLFKDDVVSQSKAFEGILVNQLKAEYFWRDPYKNEVDIIKVNDNIEPIEIKYGKVQTEGLIKFMKKFNVNHGTVISRDQERTQRQQEITIDTIPAVKYLLQNTTR